METEGKSTDRREILIHGSFGRIKKIHNNVEHREFTAADETIFGAMGFQFGRICNIIFNELDDCFADSDSIHRNLLKM